MPPIGRRTVLKLAVGSAALAALPWTPGRALAAGSAAMTAQDALLSLAFDRALRTRVAYKGKTLTPFEASEVLLLKDGSAIGAFAFDCEERQPVTVSAKKPKLILSPAKPAIMPIANEPIYQSGFK